MVSSLALSVLERQRALRLESAKARIGFLKNEAAAVCLNVFYMIVDLGLSTRLDQATFLATVQAQILSFSIQDSSTPLHVLINIFAFTGIFIDVVGAFMALLASTLIQANTDQMDRLLNAVSAYTIEELQVAVASLPRALPAYESVMERDFVMEIMIRTEKLQELGESRFDIPATVPLGIESRRFGGSSW